MGKRKKPNIARQPKIYWILLEDQVTPFMVEFLKRIRQAMKDMGISLQFKVLSCHKTAAKIASPLKPSSFSIVLRIKDKPFQNMIRKRNALGEITYTEGLPIWRTLLLDDLAGGQMPEPIIDLKLDTDLRCIVVQIPSVVGSTTVIERLFHALSFRARQRGIPIIGLEFSPLSTRWTLASSLMDEIITIRESSYDCLKACNIPSHIWLLPPYEACFCFLDCPPFWANGLGIAYRYKERYKIPEERTVIYIPYHVALIYEYREMLRHLAKFGEKLHIMFTVADDQARGTYTHQEIIEKTCRDELASLASFSFHDLNEIEDLTAADALIATCTSGTTRFSSTYGIPTIIFDRDMPPKEYGIEKFINSFDRLEAQVQEIINLHNKQTGLTAILRHVAGNEVI